MSKALSKTLILNIHFFAVYFLVDSNLTSDAMFKSLKIVLHSTKNVTTKNSKYDLDLVYFQIQNQSNLHKKR
jgi:hypothetical protein